MATPLVRVTQKQFGSQGPAGDFGIFGSKANPPQTFSMDPVQIQSLTAFFQGWGQSIIGNYEPPLEDMNSLFLLAFRQLAYIFEKGIPEYDPNINYFVGSVIQESGVIYNSLVNSNIGNDPSLDNGTNWQVGIGGQSGAVPTGATIPWGGLSTSIPSGYLLCNGAAISRTTYARLFTVVGTSYGIGDGTTTFNLPDARGRVLVGVDGTAEFLAVGNIGGEKTHTLTTPEIPSHTHTTTFTGNLCAGSNVSTILPGGGPLGPFVFTTSATGGGSSHNNLQPYLVIGGIIIKI